MMPEQTDHSESQHQSPASNAAHDRYQHVFFCQKIRLESWERWNWLRSIARADNRIRHIPVIDGTEMLGMVSIGDVVRAVVAEHREELNRLNDYIQGGY